MAPSALHPRDAAAPASVVKPSKPLKSDMTQIGLVVEAWGEGFNVGALIILMLIVVCNLRRRVLLHKLILLEVCIARGALSAQQGRQLTKIRA
jgi:hypothetical protein